jgi:hypothetical protein
MHSEILTKAQSELLPFITEFRHKYYLVGGTAISLHIGHRRSIDFDLFTNGDHLDLMRIKSILNKYQSFPLQVSYEAFDQMHIMLNKVKITFFAFPYAIVADRSFDSICVLPDLLTLGAMKVFALGGRAKWKDYVDLFYLLKFHHPLNQIITKAEDVFGDVFSSKLARQQLTYFDDIDYSEEVEHLGESYSKEEIQEFLVDVATERL